VSVVLILVSDALGGLLPFSGQYLESADLEWGNGIGSASFTTDIEKAMRFDTMVAALQFLHASPSCKPIREDGRPNRPLTATCWEFRSIDP
jgi:hypothetical protein